MTRIGLCEKARRPRPNAARHSAGPSPALPRPGTEREHGVSRFVAALCALLAFLGAATAASAAGSRPFRLAATADIACAPGEVGARPNGRPNGRDNCQQLQTAELVQHLNPNAVAIPGDIQYESGTFSEFTDSFGLSWGLLKPRIYPAPGNHEWYSSPNGAGYFDYFDGVRASNGRAGARGRGYYAVNLGRYWHLITLNSNCKSDSAAIRNPVACNRGSAQERWLRADLRAHRGRCIIAQWHHPLFTSGPSQDGINNLATRAFWDDLYQAGATLILNGHDHGYQRFAPQSPAGRPARRGVREFVLGTGGKSLFGPGGDPAENSQVYNLTTFGATIFTLYRHSYSWRFYRDPVPGNGRFADSGSASCNRPGSL